MTVFGRAGKILKSILAKVSFCRAQFNSCNCSRKSRATALRAAFETCMVQPQPTAAAGVQKDRALRGFLHSFKCLYLHPPHVLQLPLHFLAGFPVAEKTSPLQSRRAGAPQAGQTTGSSYFATSSSNFFPHFVHAYCRIGIPSPLLRAGRAAPPPWFLLLRAERAVPPFSVPYLRRARAVPPFLCP